MAESHICTRVQYSQIPKLQQWLDSGILEFAWSMEDLSLLKLTEDARILSNNAFSRKPAMLYSVHGIWNIGDTSLE